MGKKHRRIPYGTMNWELIVRECHFVDNTAYIRNLESCRTPVFLRPKRFGKSMVCSMLSHYYDILLKDRFDELFGMTDIGREPTDERNSYLILKFDFSGSRPRTSATPASRSTGCVSSERTIEAITKLRARLSKSATLSKCGIDGDEGNLVYFLTMVIKDRAEPREIML